MPEEQEKRAEFETAPPSKSTELEGDDELTIEELAGITGGTGWTPTQENTAQVNPPPSNN